MIFESKLCCNLENLLFESKLVSPLLPQVMAQKDIKWMVLSDGRSAHLQASDSRQKLNHQDDYR
jgi:hypothetical protein